MKNTRVLIHGKDKIKKLTTYVTTKDAGNLREKLFQAVAGAIGKYDKCSFNIEGKGSSKPNEEANPTKAKAAETQF